MPTSHQTSGSCCGGGHTHKKTDWLFWGSLTGVAGLLALSFAPTTLTTTLPQSLNTMAETTHHMAAAMWWGVLIGAFFVGLLSQIPRQFIMAILGPGGTTKGLVRATAAGVLLDLCSHGILMVATKLYERGASAGQIVAFLLASPWNSFSLTLILFALIGLKWTLVFIGLSMVVALICGWIFDALVARGTLPANPHTFTPQPGFKFWPAVVSGLRSTQFNGSFWRTLATHAVVDSKPVVRWLLVGILLAAALRAVLDPTAFETYFGATALGLAATILLATVLEVCSEGATPIAADILTRAKAPGNAFAFLMAGVATDYTEIMVLKDTTKSWKFALFLPLVSVPQVILLAWLINYFA